MDNNQAAELLKSVIRVNSVNGNESLVAGIIADALKQNGIGCQLVEYAPGREQLVAELSGGDSANTLGFCGHMDVVPTGELEWDYKPFDATEADGRIYGRGACDMKGGLIAMVVAMIRLKQQGCPFNGTIRLLTTAGEETGALGSKQLLEKGHAKGLQAMVIGEPTNNNVVIAHKGALWLRLTTYGKTAHGSMPSAGVNAVDHMLLLLNGLRERFNFDKYTHEKLSPPTISLNVLRGGSGTNVIPDKCVAELDLRTVPPLDHTELVGHVWEHIRQAQSKISGLKAKLEVINDLPPVYTDEDERIVKIAEAASAMITGSFTPAGVMTVYTDAAQFVKAKPQFPIAIIGPGDPHMCHRPNEFISISDFNRAIEIYSIIATDWLKQ